MQVQSIRSSRSSPARRSRAARFAIASAMVVSGLGLSCGASGQGVSTSGNPANAALYYWRAWYAQDKPLEKLCQDSYKPADPDWKPDAALTKSLEEHQDPIEQVMRSTMVAACDFGVPAEDGFNALIPHVSLMRQSARVLACDARRLEAAGKFDDAAERIAAIARMSAHTRSDHIAISSLVGTAIMTTAADECVLLLKAGKPADAARKSLTDAFKSLDKPDPFDMKGAVEGERTMAVKYLRKQIDAKGVAYLEEIGWLGAEGPKESIDALRKMDKPALLAELDKTEEFYNEVLKSWDAADAKTKLADLEKRIEKGDFGTLAKLIVPAVIKLHDNPEKSRAKLREALDALSGKPRDRSTEKK